MLVDVLNEFLNWDSKFFTTIGLLILKPWRLTNEFLAGRRARYVHPLRLYLLVSILFFFAATYSIKSAHFEPFNFSPERRAEIKEELKRDNIAPDIQEQINRALTGVPMPPERRAKLEKKLQREDLSKEQRDAIRERMEQGDLPPDAREQVEAAMKNLPPEARAKVEQALKKPMDTEHESKLVQFDKKGESSPTGKWFQKKAEEKFGEHGTKAQLFIVTLFSNLPYMMLCCIPLFAFVLKILYIRKHVFYIDHLIYALHTHAFAYLAIMVIIGATMGLSRILPSTLAGWIVALLWTLFAVQIFLSIRRVYKQGWFFSVFKFFIGGFVYLIVLSLALAATFLITLALPS